MNERIRELVKRAGGYFPTTSNGHTASLHSTDGSLQKFAELIVRECVTKMASEIMNNSWIDDAVKNTYEHFGVE